MSPDTHDPCWLDYLFYRHPRAELVAWARRLRYFRFCKAYGGHANDGDQLLAALRYTDEPDLTQLLLHLGLAGAGGAHRSLASPGRVTLAGHAVFLSVRRAPVQQLEFSIFDLDNPYEVTARAVAAAEAVEELLVAHEVRLVDPPQPNHHCLCPAYYPELWAAG